MGSCLSSFLAEIFIDHIENNLILFDRNKEILFWTRYIDDCLCILNTDAEGAEFLQKINHIHPTIKFTLETEIEKKTQFS